MCICVYILKYEILYYQLYIIIINPIIYCCTNYHGRIILIIIESIYVVKLFNYS